MNVRKRKRMRGSVLVEAALVLPLFTLLFVGIIEFGRVLMIKQVITNAAREGARVAAINLDDDQALSSAMNTSQTYIVNSGVDSNFVTIDPHFSLTEGTEAVQVTIDYDYTSGLGGWVPGIPDIIKLRSQVTMRREA
ncbi:MAG: pilus assembly protein [Candidatus Omnitrophica bacterium]|nr:pilus assembly protein [Candidatus Omnitrophota bacterium]